MYVCGCVYMWVKMCLGIVFMDVWVSSSDYLVCLSLYGWVCGEGWGWGGEIEKHRECVW